MTIESCWSKINVNPLFRRCRDDVYASRRVRRGHMMTHFWPHAVYTQHSQTCKLQENHIKTVSYFRAWFASLRTCSISLTLISSSFDMSFNPFFSSVCSVCRVFISLAWPVACSSSSEIFTACSPSCNERRQLDCCYTAMQLKFIILSTSIEQNCYSDVKDLRRPIKLEIIFICISQSQEYILHTHNISSLIAVLTMNVNEVTN